MVVDTVERPAEASAVTLSVTFEMLSKRPCKKLVVVAVEVSAVGPGDAAGDAAVELAVVVAVADDDAAEDAAVEPAVAVAVADDDAAGVEPAVAVADDDAAGVEPIVAVGVEVFFPPNANGGVVLPWSANIARMYLSNAATKPAGTVPPLFSAWHPQSGCLALLDFPDP
jgi:hypothetical protein